MFPGKLNIMQSMTEQSSTVEDQTASPSSPVEVTSSATGSDMTSSASGFYFKCAVVFIGVVGTAANALILYAMVASKQHKKQVLIFNQNALDLYSCLFLVITYVAKLCNVYLSGTLGYWLCMIFFSENLLWCGIIGSIINLAAITVERYLKVVHAVWSKNKLHKWMIYSAGAFSWLSAIVYNQAVNFSTSAVIDGVCYGSVVWKSRVAAVAHGIWNFVSFYAFMLLLFTFCYWRILMAIRHQASVLAGHTTAGPSTFSDPVKPDSVQHHQDNDLHQRVRPSTFSDPVKPDSVQHHQDNDLHQSVRPSTSQTQSTRFSPTSSRQ